MMADAGKQTLGDILGRALAEIDEAGGSSQHQLKQLIGAKVFDGMRAKQRTSALIDRWVNAGPKSKAAATRALAVGIARHSDRPELLARIERELSDSFNIDLPRRSGPEREAADIKRKPTAAETETYRKAVNQRRNDQHPSGYRPPKDVDLAMLAKRSDLTSYIKERRER